MRLSRDAFNLLFDAVSDRAQNRGVFDLLATQCHRPPTQFAGDNDLLPLAIKKLIEDCAAQDTLEGFIGCLKQRYGGNPLIDGLDFATLATGPSDDEVVAAGEGTNRFKVKLRDALAQIDQPGMQLVAGQDLFELLDGASDAEARTLYLAVLGNSKIDRSPEVASSLAAVLSKALKRLIGEGDRPEDLELGLDRTRLSRIDLSDLDLHGADIAFADLRYANLDGANLYRARGYAVDISNAGFNSANLVEARLHTAVAVKSRFHNARMISSFFKGADLREAGFQQAKLQGAHFEKSDLSGAKFEQANVSDAYFTGATFDEATISSISRAAGWESARFDPEARASIAAAG